MPIYKNFCEKHHQLRILKLMKDSIIKNNSIFIVVMMTMMMLMVIIIIIIIIIIITIIFDLLHHYFLHCTTTICINSSLTYLKKTATTETEPANKIEQKRTVWTHGRNKCCCCLPGGKGCRLKVPHQIPSAS